MAIEYIEVDFLHKVGSKLANLLVLIRLLHKQNVVNSPDLVLRLIFESPFFRNSGLREKYGGFNKKGLKCFALTVED